MANERQEGPFEKIGEAVGGTVGKMVGRANDMAMNVAGSVLGSAVGMLGDWWSSPDADQAAKSFSEQEDRACRDHFNSRTASQSSRVRDYESARPVYQFGYMAGQNPEYQAKPFDRVEADLERAWEEAARERFGDWPEVRDQVSFGFSYRSSDKQNAS